MTADTTSPDFWVRLFAERPEVLHALLSDIYSLTRNHAGVPRSGTRKRPGGDGTLDELWDMLTPRFSSSPLPCALRELMAGESIRPFAARACVSRSLLHRLLAGQPTGPITMGLLEQLARAGGVHPAYFSEWRRLWLMSLLDDALTAKPNLSVGFYRKFTGAGQRVS